MAARFNHLNVVKALINAGASIDITKYNDGNTPLLGAVFAGNKGIANYLVEQGADKNIKNHYGKSFNSLYAEPLVEKNLEETTPNLNTNEQKECSKEEILKMINAGYKKNEIDEVCTHKIQKPIKNSKNIKSTIMKILKNDRQFSREFLETLKITYSNGMVIIYNNCSYLSKINNQKLSRKYEQKPKKKPNPNDPNAFWDSFIETNTGDNIFKESIRYSGRCSSMLSRASKLAKAVDGVNGVEIIKR